jgi:formylglycine-generating enzyme required for sulfatase activity
MLEVQGKYCEDVMHRCTKGGKNHTGDDDDQPEPFYCDAYQTGFAKCFGKEEPKHFCIDEFEYPNKVEAIPMVMVSWFESQRLCKLQGKRLCGDDEWTLACEGPERLPYPYGWARDKTACNIDHLWIAPNDGLLSNKAAPAMDIQTEVERLSKRAPSGSMPRCKSPYGVMDMTGNVDEWAVNVTFDGKPFQSVFKGGHWVSGARNRCRPVTTSHDEYTTYYAEGFRCCADVPLTAEK